MSHTLIKIINAAVYAVSSFYIVKYLVKGEKGLFNTKNLSLTMLIMIFPVVLFEEKYTALNLLLSYITSIMVFVKIFNISKTTSILACSAAIVLFAFVDMILSSIELSFITYEQARNTWYILLVNNTLIFCLSVWLSKRKRFINIFQNACLKVNSDKKISIIIFASLNVLVIGLLYYNINYIFKLNLAYIITIICMSIFFLLYYFYMDERNNYEKLHEEYSTVFDYVQNFENWIDDEQMYRHELKNNLSMIRGMTKEKKVIKKVEDMLGAAIIVEDQYVEQLRSIPKGGLKGLLYYKIAIASNNKVNMIAEVSPKVTERIEELGEAKLRQICILLGIYLDNAIEAATQSEKKIVTLEVYLSKERLNFVVSNTYENDIPLEEIKKKGYSTKGEGRGKGLHYAEKVVNKNKDLNADNIILNEYYIQTLSIN